MDVRIENDSLGPVSVPADKLWGAQTQRSLEHFSIGNDLMPREMISACATLKKAAALANQDGQRLARQTCALVVQACDEILAGKVNPTQCEALTMLAVQVMANDVAVGFGGAGGYLEMNVYKPLIIFNITHSITLMTDGCVNFRRFLIEGTEPNLKNIQHSVEQSLVLVTALAPVIGYDKASKIAHHAMDHDLTLKAAALQLGFVDEAQFDRIVDPRKMVSPYVAADQ